MPQLSISERTLSYIWHKRGFSAEMRTSDGRGLSVIYPGMWTHSDGPDFADAMLEIDGRLLTGSVELHLKSSDWYRHGHDKNPAYDRVVLHVVLNDDLDEVVTTSANLHVDTLEIERYLGSPDHDFLEMVPLLDLGSLGVSTCLPSLAHGREEKIRKVLREKGWERLVSKQLAIQQDLTRLPAGEVLHRKMLDGLGLLRNRDGMRLLGERLPLVLLEQVQASSGFSGLLATLLGTAGFLPLSDRQLDAAMVSRETARLLDQAFATTTAQYDFEPISVSQWTLNRVRPANHPVRRLASYADLLMRTTREGLLSAVLESAEETSVSWQTLLKSASPPIGQSRNNQLLINVLAPFVAAYASVYENQELLEVAFQIWECLPGRKDDQITKQTLQQIVGDARFPIRTALENQGLHQIGRFGCRKLRCFECPIAQLALGAKRLG